MMMINYLGKGIIRLETLIELKFINSTFRAYLLFRLDKRFSVEQFEATIPQSAVSSPLLTVIIRCCKICHRAARDPSDICMCILDYVIQYYIILYIMCIYIYIYICVYAYYSYTYPWSEWRPPRRTRAVK